MRLFSWNVNGIRAIGQKGFVEWFEQTQPDVLCVQETKAHRDQVEPALREPSGYKSVWHSAKRRGYSGVATYYKSDNPPEEVESLDVPEFDEEGRYQALIFPEFVLINAYFPNSQPERKRLDYKLMFFDAVSSACRRYRGHGRHVIVCGDFNVSHKEIDLARPKENRDNPGFYVEECAAMDAFLETGFIDSFRHFHPGEPGHYTWWSYRTRARERNIGWRLDYHCVDEAFLPRVQKSQILSDVMGSDHCPIALHIQ